MGLTSMCRTLSRFWRWLVTIEKDDVSTNWLWYSSLSLVYGSYGHVPFSYCIVSYGIALYNMVLNCILWYLIVVVWLYHVIFHAIAWYCIISYGIALYCMVLHCILWYLMVVTYNLLWLCLVLHCTSWYWMLLHCIIQYCTVLHSIA